MQKLLHNPNLMAILCGMAAFAVVVLIWMALIERDVLPAERLKGVQRRRTELREIQHKKTSRRASMQRVNVMKEIVGWFRLERGRRFQGLRIKLARAGYRSRDAMFVFLFLKLLMPLVIALAAGFFLFVLHVGKFGIALRILGVLLGGLFGWALPNIMIKNQTQKREDALRKGMPDSLDLLVICAEAGLSLDSGFERVSREIANNTPELAEEMGLTAVELNFLPDRSQALQALADRVALPGMMALVNTLLQTEKYGTPLAQALRVLSAEMREERIMKAEEKAARLPAILTVPMILFILPPLFIVLIGPAALKVMEAMAASH